MTIRRWILLAVSVCVAITAIAGAAWAQGGDDGEALLAAGAKAINAGSYKAAARDLSRAMRSDSLSTAQIAKALFLRGVAHKNAGMPAQAIADLDSALWLQGLSNKDLAQAYLTRGESYRAVGMDELAGADLRRAKEVDPNARTVVAARKAPDESEVGAFTTQVETARAETFSRNSSRSAGTRIPGFPNPIEAPAARRPPPQKEQVEPEKREAARKPVPEFRTEVREARRKPAPKPKPQQVPSFRTSILPDEKPEQVSVAQDTAPPARWARPHTEPSAKEKKEKSSNSRRSEGNFSKPKSTVSSFFSGLWGGGDKKETGAEAPAPDLRQPPAADWSKSTKVASAQAAPASAAAAPRQGGRSDGGTYRIQLASLRTEDEAQSTWRQLSARHGALLAGQEHFIEKTTVGSLGTFYRIQIGPFTDKAESTQLCSSLKSSGVDCFLVAR